jgi:hypothetical protein
MAERKPLVNIDGMIQELPAGDTVAGASGGSGGGSLTYANDALDASVNITPANNFVDGPSVSLAAGTWLVIGHVTVNKAATTLSQYTARITTGTTHYASTQASHPSQNPHAVSMTMATVIILAAPTAIKIQVAATATGSTLQSQTASNASGLNATQITAVQLA